MCLVRSISSTSIKSKPFLSSPNHPSSCNCARCSSSPIAIRAPPSRPTAATPINNSSSLSLFKRNLGSISSPNHPTTCLCARCSSSPIGLTPPTRPSTVSGGSSLVGSQSRGMKVRSAIKKYCDACSIVKRQGTVFVICSKDPKHKQVSLISL